MTNVAFERLERSAWKLARYVLRGAGLSDGVGLLDVRHEVAKASCSHSMTATLFVEIKEEPPLPLGESRDLNKERSRQCVKRESSCEAEIVRGLFSW